MRAIFCLLALQTLPLLSLYGAPASGETATITINGSSVTVEMRGDENYHWFEDENNNIIGRKSDGSWAYMEDGGSGNLVEAPSAALSNLPAESFFNTLKLGTITNSQTSTSPQASGTIKNLVILAAFSDHWDSLSSHSASDNNIDIDDYTQLFEGSSTSLKSYFKETSLNSLVIESTLSNWIKLDKEESYYGADDEFGKDLRSDELISDALDKLSTSANTGLSTEQITIGPWDMLTVIHSGKNQARIDVNTLNSGNTSLWSTWGNLSADKTLGSGNQIYRRYVTHAALGGANNTSASDLGSLCHEVANYLGLPDLYDYGTSDNTNAGFGVGNWGLMGTGCWGASGNISTASTPVHPSAWSKLKLDWLEAEEVTLSGNAYKLPPINLTKKALHRWGNEEEYYLAEYRNTAGYNSQLATFGQAGVLIWHIDEGIFSTNQLSLKSNASWDHPIVRLEEADNNDSLGQALKKIEKGDIWTSGDFTATSSANTTSFHYDDSSYYQRHDRTNSANLQATDFTYSNGYFTYDYANQVTQMFIANSTDFSSGTISWYAPFDESEGYLLQRNTGSGWSTIVGDNIIFTDNSYHDEDIEGSVDFRYRILINGESTYSPEFYFGLRVESAVFTPNSQLLTLNFNTDINLENGMVDLTGIYILDSSGANLFQLRGDSKSDYSLPGLKMNQTDGGAIYESSDTPSTALDIYLSDIQLYEMMDNSDRYISDFSLSILPDSTQVSGGANIFNIEQSDTRGNPVSIDGIIDSTSPIITASSYNNINNQLIVYFNEPIYSADLDGAKVSISGSGFSTDLFGSGNLASGNKLIFTPTPSQQVKIEILLGLTENSIEIATEESLSKDYSSVTSAASSNVSVNATITQQPPFVSNFTLNNHEDTRAMTLFFSEPIFFADDYFPIYTTEFGIDLNRSMDYSDNILAVTGNTLTVNQDDEETFADLTFKATGSITVDLTLEEADRIDEYFGEYTFPAPKIFGRINNNIYMDSLNYFQSPQINNADTNKIASSGNYLPRRRAFWQRPFDASSNIQYGLNWKEDPNWRGYYRINYIINGGWVPGDTIRLEWENDLLGQMEIMDEPGYQLGSNVQVYDWNSSALVPLSGYVLSLRSPSSNTLYSQSMPLELDNIRPTVSISYISKTTPSHQVNAVDDVTIMATYSEPMIDLPEITISQDGTHITVATMASQSGNISLESSGSGLTSDNIFLYTYDVGEQDGLLYLDGAGYLELSSIRDRAKGDNIFTGLPEDHPDLEGNRSLPITDGTDVFSIDSVSPTVASLEFSVEDESVVDEFSTLQLSFSEDLLSYATPSEDGIPFTQVLNPEHFILSGSATGGGVTRVTKVTGFGAGPYELTLDGIVTKGQLILTIANNTIRDFHGNYVGSPDSAEAVWPGPLVNLHPVYLSPGGRTRLLLSGGFLPYNLSIDPFYSEIATVADDGKSILGHSMGIYTIQIVEAKRQTRFVNTQIINQYINQVQGEFDAFRDELDFQLVSFPFNINEWKGQGLIDLLKDHTGDYINDYILYHYDKAKSEQGYLAMTTQSTEVGPGYGFWMATRKDKKLDMSFSGPLKEQVIGIDLHAGWNIIGNPFDEEISLEQIYISTNASRFNISDPQQAETGHHIWYSDLDNPLYVSLKKLPPFTGAWLYVDNPKGAEIFFYKNPEDIELDDIDFEPWPREKSQQKLSLRSVDEASGEPVPPARPSANFDGEQSSSSGGGGCLLKREIQL
ncbi:MAG: M6 family metalloprotease domain-containing protein [Planctomycetes bacterium]|nr:M6 family metalloprotease domain-containing protein [Planctomycetota bacterium]